MTARTRIRGFDDRRTPPPGLGAMLRSARERAGLSLRLMAYAAGISPSHALHLEAGRRCPSVQVADALTEVLQLLPDELAVLRSAAVADAGRDSPLRLRHAA